MGLVYTYLWAAKHRAHNKLMHALHGNGRLLNGYRIVSCSFAVLVLDRQQAGGHLSLKEYVDSRVHSACSIMQRGLAMTILPT